MADEVTFDEAQQALFDKTAGEIRKKVREQVTAEYKAQAEKDKAEAERNTLAAGEKWQELAEQHAARVGELEPLEAQVKAYQEVVEEMLKNRVKEFGDAAKVAVKALPKSLTNLEKLNWLNKNQELFDAGPSMVGTPAKRKRVATNKGRDGRRPARL